MKNALRSVLTGVAAAVLAACGGSGGNAALSKTFTYGSPQAPSSAESSAASSAQSSLSDTASFSSSPSASKGASIVVFADLLATAALGDSGAPIMHRLVSDSHQALRTAADYSNCTTVTATTVTFSNCTVTESGSSFTLNGTISAAAGTVTWNVTGNFSGTSNGTSFNLTIHEGGTMTVTASKITGNATFDFGGSVSAQGQTVNFGLASAAVVDLTYQTTPSYCLTAGSVEVKRVWTQKPSGSNSSAFTDAAVKITWSGCNSFQVAHSQ